MRGKGDTLLKKGCPLSPAPPFPFLKLLILGDEQGGNGNISPHVQNHAISRPCFSPPTSGNPFLCLDDSTQAGTALPFQKVPTESSPDLSLSLKIWKSLPLTRLSGAGRTGVGHSRWVRKDTPALSPQTEQSLPSSPASAVPCCTPDVARGPRALKDELPAALPPSPTASGIIFPFTLSCRTGEAGRQKQGGAGGIISPACLSCLFCLYFSSALAAAASSAT